MFGAFISLIFWAVGLIAVSIAAEMLVKSGMVTIDGEGVTDEHRKKVAYIFSPIVLLVAGAKTLLGLATAVVVLASEALAKK
jgi:hypothetical protein